MSLKQCVIPIRKELIFMHNTDRLCLGCMNDNGGEQVCSICGYDAKTKNPKGSLPAGTWLEDRFLIGKVLDSNGEGISYIGWDNFRDCVVYIREYFPTVVAKRNADGSVAIAEGGAYAFNEGILEFLELNRKLANIGEELPSLSPVTAVFEHGGSAYAVSKAPAASITLREFLMRNGGTLTWDQVRPLFLPLFTTIDKLHQAGIIHGGISPETVLVCRDGKLRISGICIKPIRTTSTNLEYQLFPGFAAPEQYGITEAGDIGAHTDVYAIAATVFRVLMGTNPPEASERLESDNMAVPSKIAQQLPKSVLTALANALQVYSADRTADMEFFKSELLQAENDAPVLVPDKKTGAKSDTEGKAKNKFKFDQSKKYALIAAGVTIGVFAVIISLVLIIMNKPSDNSSDITSTFVSVPQVNQAGDVAESYTSTENLYSVPDLKKVPLSKILDNDDYEMFKFKVAEKRYDNQIAPGAIIEQSVAAGTSVKRETEISVVVSLGPQNVTVPSVKAKTKDEAIIALLKAGFLYDNIDVKDKWDDTQAPLMAISTDPATGTKANVDGKIYLYINSYKGKTETSGEVYSSNISSTQNDVQ